MIKPLVAAICLGAAALPLASQAEGPYFGVTGLYADRPGYDDVDGSWGGTVFAGYRFSPLPLYIEASYINTGDADVDPGYYDNERLKLNFSGYTVGLGYFLPLTTYGSGIFARASYYGGDTKLKTPDDPTSHSQKQSTSGASIAVGGDWKWTPTMGLRFEYENLIEPDDFANDENIGLWKVGLIFDFPTVQSSSRY
ncbi:outer membrane beta-barrel protein [Solimonas marina]|uniref:Porin family protein n=1 Tax=Solimonas marina TaxID=2714601 RepID=A0A970B9S6_9GAMM|nr:outer membrane beta-barrel protein [Solimonas marina]NKF22656.1 porin family protein [Solimonas marina]